MTIKSIIYEDGCGNQFPLKIGGCRINSSQELEIVAAAQGICDDDTISIRIIKDCAEIGVGDPIQDKDDVTGLHSDAKGNLVLEGLGG